MGSCWMGSNSRGLLVWRFWRAGADREKESFYRMLALCTALAFFGLAIVAEGSSALIPGTGMAALVIQNLQDGPEKPKSLVYS